MVLLRPLVHANSLLSLGRNAVEEEQALLFMLLNNLPVRKAAAQSDFIELRFGVQLSRCAAAEKRGSRNRLKRLQTPHFTPGNIEATLMFATAGALVLQLLAAPLTTWATCFSTLLRK
jgi:hypothetical protein